MTRLFNQIDSVLAYQDWAHNPDLYRYICKKDNLTIFDSPTEWAQSVERLQKEAYRVDLINAIYDRKFMGLSESDSICAVAETVKHRVKRLYNIKLNNYRND